MDNEKCCYEHSGHENRIKNLEDDQIADRHNIDAAHRRLDGMKNWVIAGMTALVLQLLLHILKLLSSAPSTPPPGQ